MLNSIGAAKFLARQPNSLFSQRGGNDSKSPLMKIAYLKFLSFIRENCDTLLVVIAKPIFPVT
jgi:hypothetical protein